MSSGRRVLLTGGTGFLGRAVADALAAAGHHLTLLVRPGRRPQDLPPEFGVAEGDIVRPDSLQAALQPDSGARPDSVIHLAALVQMWMPDAAIFDEVNVEGLANVLDAARVAGVEKVVYASSFMALGPSRDRPLTEADDPSREHFHNDYERTKYLADQLARRRAEAGEPITLVYPAVVYGPGALTAGGLVTRQILEFLRGRLPGILGPGDRPVCYAYVHDVAAGVVAALERGKPGRGYILGGENATLNEFMNEVARASDLPPPRRHIPYSVASLLGRLQWWRAQLTGKPPELTHQVVGIYRKDWAYDCRRAQDELGYRVTPLRQGLEETVRWLRESGLAV